MSLHHRDQASGPETIDMSGSGSAAEKALLPPVSAISLKFDTVWKVDIHDGNGYQTLSDQTAYTPPMRVRYVNVCDESFAERNIEFNLAGNGDLHKRGTEASPCREFQNNIIERLKTNERHAMHLTRIFLADSLQRTSGTNATFIVLLG
jgi:hypothetical protein